MYKKITRGIILALFLLIFVGCGENKDDKIKIGILQPIEHESLDDARKGFIDGLADAGYVNGKNIEIDYKNANGDQANNTTIANTFMNQKKNLILAIGTPAAQSLASKIKDTPILFTAVTDPVLAGLVKDLNKPEANITGTSDKLNVDEQVQMLLDFDNKIKTVGLLYSSAEDNSVSSIEQVKKYLQSKGLKYLDMTVQNTNDVQSVIENSINSVDAIYIPTDNTIASSMVTVSKFAIENKKPIVAGAIKMAEVGCIGTKGIDYYELGKQTANMAVKLLNKTKNIQDLPVETSKNFTTYINKDIIKKIGLNIPEKYKK